MKRTIIKRKAVLLIAGFLWTLIAAAGIQAEEDYVFLEQDGIYTIRIGADDGYAMSLDDFGRGIGTNVELSSFVDGAEQRFQVLHLEGEGESYLLNSGANLKADVLKIGHHGGNTSTTDAFLKAVDPQIAVISVGTENKHGHPHSETLKKLSKHNIVVYRTDEFGDILLISDGNTWRTEVSKAR